MRRNRLVVKRAQPRVLIVDDESHITEILQSVLESRFDLSITNDPVEAAYWLKQFQFVGIITDLKMPNLSGTGLIQKAKAANPGIKIIVISGNDELEFGDSLAWCRPYKFISKPFPMLLDLKDKVQTYFAA